MGTKGFINYCQFEIPYLTSGLCTESKTGSGARTTDSGIALSIYYLGRPLAPVGWTAPRGMRWGSCLVPLLCLCRVHEGSCLLPRRQARGLLPFPRKLSRETVSRLSSGSGYFRLPNDDEDMDDLLDIDYGRLFPLDPGRKQLLLNEMTIAFDNLPDSEVSDILESICLSRDVDTCAQLLELTAMMEKLYAELRRRSRGSGIEDLDDAARVLRSRIRTCAKSHLAKLNKEDSFRWPW